MRSARTAGHCESFQQRFSFEAKKVPRTVRNYIEDKSKTAGTVPIPYSVIYGQCGELNENSTYALPPAQYISYVLNYTNS